MELHATVGDTIEVDATHIGEAKRSGEIIEVIGEGDRIHYRVRWNDGHESVFYPAATAHVVHRAP